MKSNAIKQSALIVLFAAGVMSFASTTGAQEMQIQEFPAGEIDFSKSVDPAHPMQTIYSGAYQLPVPVGDAERSALVYLSEGYSQTQGFVLIVPAANMTPSQVLLAGGWKQVADDNDLMLMILDPQGMRSYDLSMDGPDYAYIAAAARLANTRDHYRMPEGRNYVVGYGGGGDLALKFVDATLPNNWAGVVTFGDLSISANDLSNDRTEIPMWMFVSRLDSEQALVDRYKQINNTTDEAFSNEDADAIFFPKQQTVDLLLNDQPMSQVRYTVVRDSGALVADRASAVYDFLSLGTREVGYGDKAMRYTHDVEDWNVTTRSMQLDGVTRSWLEYVPTSLRYTSSSGAPLVVALHGGSLSGEYFAERTQWIRLAEERGFIIVFPTGSIASGIAPRWNTSRDPSMWDDTAFVKALTQEVISRLPVDRSRVYLYGHSNGSSFTQNLITYMDGFFAAAAGTGSVMQSETQPEHQYETPVFVIMGEFDNSATSIDDPATQRFVDYFTKYNKASAAGSYREGRYRIYVWENSEGAPVLQYGLAENMPHTSTLNEGFTIYDWLSQFNRQEDGSIGYRTGVYVP